MKLIGGKVEADRLKDIEAWTLEFKETLTEEPGLMDEETKWQG